MTEWPAISMLSNVKQHVYIFTTISLHAYVMVAMKIHISTWTNWFLIPFLQYNIVLGSYHLAVMKWNCNTNFRSKLNMWIIEIDHCAWIIKQQNEQENVIFEEDEIPSGREILSEVYNFKNIKKVCKSRSRNSRNSGTINIRQNR